MVNGIATYTTLEVPPHRTEDAHLAQALLLAGSGPTATEITDALDPMGIMTLRVDTPGDDPACACGPRPGPPRPTLPPTGPPHRPTVAVITSMTAGPDQTPPCQVDIRLDRATAPVESSRQATDSDPAALRLDVAGHAQPDIIVDTGPSGPVIRHIQPATTPPPVS